MKDLFVQWNTLDTAILAKVFKEQNQINHNCKMNEFSKVQVHLFCVPVQDLQIAQLERGFWAEAVILTGGKDRLNWEFSIDLLLWVRI